MTDTINDRLRNRPQSRATIADEDGTLRTLSGQTVATGGVPGEGSGMTPEQQAKLDGLPTGAALTTALAGKASLVGGKLDPSQVPDIALQQYLGAVANEAAMLALAGQLGDWCTRSDTGTDWRLVGNPATLAGWLQTAYPSAPVSSVNGKAGAVTLAKGDVGLGNVDNTSDANKPVSTAQAEALATKMNATMPALQSVFDGGTAAQKAAFRDSVSGGKGAYTLATGRCGAIGDSMTQDHGYSQFNQACAANGALLKAKNAGIGGQTTTQMVARIATDLPASLKLRSIMIAGGTNDVTQGISDSVTCANLLAMCRYARLIGATPFVALLPPRSDSAAYRDATITKRAAIKTACADAGVILADPYANFIGPDGGWLPGSASDNVHPTSATANAGAREMLRQLAPNFGGVLGLPLIPGLPGALYSNYMLADADSNGLPDGWSGYTTNGLVAAAQTLPIAAGGNELVLSTAGVNSSGVTTVGDYVASYSLTGLTLAAGQRVAISAQVKMTGYSSGIRAYVRGTTSGAGNPTAADYFVLWGDIDGYCYGEVTLSAPITSMTIQVMLRATGASTPSVGELRVSGIQIWDVAAAGLA